MTILDANGRALTTGPRLGAGVGTIDERQYQHLAEANRPAIDLKYQAWSQNHGQITVIGTWMLNSFEKPPCLVLLRKNSPLGKRGTKYRPTPCIVPEATSWMWHEPPVGDEVQAGIMARDFCLYLGLDPLRTNDVLKVIDAIRAHLEDLLRMPLCPQQDTIPAGEVRLRLSDGTIVEQELKHEI